MTALYNCKQIDANHFRITKFDSGFVPFEHHDGTVSSYTCSESGCDCPQGHKPSCRHRKMLPFFLEEEHVDDNYFFCWDTHQWVKATGIFAEAVEEQKPNVEELETVMVDENTFLSETSSGALFHPGMTKHLEGSPKDVSAAPSPQPSTKSYRRMR